MFEHGQLHGKAEPVMVASSGTDPGQFGWGERLEPHELAWLRGQRQDVDALGWCETRPASHSGLHQRYPDKPVPRVPDQAS